MKQTIWIGPQYKHGPRLHPPSRYSKFRVGIPTKKGVRLVFGKVKGTNKWEVQSKLTPIKKRFYRRKKLKGKRIRKSSWIQKTYRKF